MIVKFKYGPHAVTVDDDNGVFCDDKGTREWFLSQFELNLDSISSPAGKIGEQMEKARYEVEFIPSNRVY